MATALLPPVLVPVIAAALALVMLRGRARRRRRYVRLEVVPYRTDRVSPDALVAMFESLQRRVVVRGWRRVLCGQPSVALELHVLPTAARGCQARLAACCPDDLVSVVRATLRAAYPNLRLQAWAEVAGDDLALVRLKKRERFTTPLRRAESVSPSDRGVEPLADRLLRVMAAAASRSVVQVALTPAPLVLERWTRSRAPGGDSRSAHRERPAAEPALGLVDDSQNQPSGLGRVSGPLFFGELRVLAPDRVACTHIASELRTAGQLNPLVQRGAGLLRWGRVRRGRLERGEGRAVPGVLRGVYAASELAMVWQLPSVGFTAVPLERASVPVVPAPPAIRRPGSGSGLLEDELGAVTLHPQVRWQNVAVSGAVGLGKSSFVVASIREDLCRPRCAVIVLDPKGDAADAALSAVPEGRTCTLLAS